MPTQAETVATLRALHERPGAFVIPNPWDPGSARLLAGLGFEALATTSAGFAWSRGRPDYRITRTDALIHCAEIAAATPLPVNADWRTASRTTPPASPIRSRWPARPASRPPRSRTPLAIRKSRSTISSTPSSASVPASPPPVA